MLAPLREREKTVFTLELRRNRQKSAFLYSVTLGIFNYNSTPFLCIEEKTPSMRRKFGFFQNLRRKIHRL